MTDSNKSMTSIPSECDVVVVGEGIAGCIAALTVADCGVDVCVIEKAPRDEPHGNTAFSGGSFRRISKLYPAEKFYSDIMNLSGGKSDPELTKVVVEGSRDARDFLTRLGVPWTQRSRDPAASDQAAGQGKALAEVIRKSVEAKGISIHHEAEAADLIRKGSAIAVVRGQTKNGRFEI